jgi:hypothetical protein
MSVEVRYRTLVSGKFGEELLRVDDSADVHELMRVLATAAPFGVSARRDDGPFNELVVGLQGDVGALVLHRRGRFLVLARPHARWRRAGVRRD